MNVVRRQRTIVQPVAVFGYGYWSGKDVRVEFRPAPPNSGITFVRDDLKSAGRIPARFENRIEVPRRTCLRMGSAQVDMVEHILAALAGLHVDNCEVGIDQSEAPGCDGSAMAFVAALDSVGIVEQSAPAKRLEITEHVRLAEGDTWIEAVPSLQGTYSVEYTVHYPSDSVIGHQIASFEVTPQVFRDELAPCRTFVLEREAQEMIRNGKGTRVRSQDLLILGENGPLQNRLRFDNECARHKALDVIGDLALTGCEIVGQITAFRSGHRLNSAFANELVTRFTTTGLRKSA